MNRGQRFGLALAALVAGGASVTLATTARAGGMFLPMRGVRQTGRAGAFVAGANDAGAIWFNPAGLAELAGGKQRHSMLVDLALIDHAVTYTRIDSGGNAQAPVENDPQKLPIPTVAATFDTGQRTVIAVGLLAPYTALDGYAEDGPQRYSLVSLHGSTLAILEVAFGFKVNDALRIGAGVQNLFLGFRSRVVFSSCPGETICAPEDPDWDAMGEIEQNSFFNPSGVLGAQLSVNDMVHVGAALQLPFLISSAGTVKVRLPASGFFNGAHVEGDGANVELDFPAMARFGIELRPSKQWRVEAGLDWEMWSMQDHITITPKNIRIEDAAGVGTYDLGPIRIPRNFDDTFALRLGVEGAPSRHLPLVVRAGYVFETGAAPDEYLSVLTVDANKHVLTFGLGWQVGKTRVDASVAQVFEADRDVARGTSCSPQLNPIRTGEDPAAEEICVHDGSPDHVYVGDGRYTSSWTVLGLGLNVDF